MTQQNECKHDNAGNKRFCPDCGKEMADEGIERLANAVLNKIKPELEKLAKEKKKEEAPEEQEYESQLDRVLGRRKKS